MPVLDNEKHELFAQHYAVVSNATQAAIAAGYGENSARTMGSKVSRKPEVQERVEEIRKEIQERLTDATELRVMDIVAGLLKEARALGVPNTTQAARVRAWELLGKHLGMWPKDEDDSPPAAAAGTITGTLKLTIEREVIHRELSSDGGGS